MKIDRDKTVGGITASGGERGSRQFWPGKPGEDDVDYEALFRSFMEKLFANRGSFKVDGSLLFEFLPKANVRNEKLISAETSFYFHQLEEGDGFYNETHKNDNYRSDATASYRYHEPMLKVSGGMEEFIPFI
jgi:hypothetical protein